MSSSSIARSRSRVLVEVVLVDADRLGDLVPTVYTGFSAASGSWKIIAISCPRSFSMSRSERSNNDEPRNLMSPVIVADFGSSRRIASELTLLPDPDSPTIPTVSWSWTSKVTESTACTVPSSVENDTDRSCTDSSGACGSPIGAASSRG